MFTIIVSIGVTAACRSGGAWTPPATTVVPRYPPVLLSAGIEGDVLVSFRVLPDGSVDPLSVVVDSATNRAWHEPTIAAVRQWRFAAPADTARRAVRITNRVKFAPFASPPRFACPPFPTSAFGAWKSAGPIPTLAVTGCKNMMVPRDQVDRNRRAAGMPPLPPARP